MGPRVWYDVRAGSQFAAQKEVKTGQSGCEPVRRGGGEVCIEELERLVLAEMWRSQGRGY